MKAATKSGSSILSVAPGTRYFGFAVFERGELVRYGVRCLTDKKNKEDMLRRVEALLETLLRRHRPTVLAVEDLFYREARQSRLLRHLVIAVKKWGETHQLRTVAYLPTVVKAHFCEGRKKTRPLLAAAMVRRYWFLYSYLKPGRTQHYWRQLFDAVALGAFANEDLTSRKPSA